MRRTREHREELILLEGGLAVLPLRQQREQAIQLARLAGREQQGPERSDRSQADAPASAVRGALARRAHDQA